MEEKNDVPRSGWTVSVYLLLSMQTFLPVST